MIYFYCSGLNSTTFHPDESQWIATSSVFEAYFGADFSSPLWDESYWTITQPPLPRYVIGFGRWMGGFGIFDINLPWVFELDGHKNFIEGRMPSTQLLWWSRFPMAVLAALSIFIVFILLNRFAGRLPGYIWVALCLLSAYFPKMLDRAMAESPLLACISSTLFITHQLLQVPNNQELKKPDKLYLYFLLLGISAGLAESSKLNGLSVIAVGFAIVLIIGVRLKQTRQMKIRFGLISVLVLIFSSQLTFISLNPYLWKSPLDRTATLFYYRVYEMSNQQHNYPDSRIQGFGERVEVVTNRIFQSYATIHFDGAMWINIIFFIIGLTYLILRAVQYLKNLHANSASLAILFVGAAASLPPLFTLLDWDRYYLLPVYFSTLAIAVGIGWLGSFVYRLIKTLL